MTPVIPGNSLPTDQHPVLGTVRYTAHALPYSADGQVSGTIDIMRAKVAEDSANPAFVQRAQEIAGMGSQADKVRRVWAHAKNSIKFQRDELTGLSASGLGIGGCDPDSIVETIIRPRDMANYIDQGIAIGDCDDFSMYVAALLTALGIQCAFCTVAASASEPDQFSHVYVASYPDGERLPVDSSHGDYCGWEVEPVSRRQEWAVVGLAAWYAGEVMRWMLVAGGAWFAWQWLKSSGYADKLGIRGLAA